MEKATLEHVNITVEDPKKTASMFHRLFGWDIRWEGPSLGSGYTIHVGNDHSYLALYSPGGIQEGSIETYNLRGGLNHIALVVEDLDAVEKRVVAEGLIPRNYGNYEPGRRFYFYDADQVEYEVVSYITQKKTFKNQVTRELGKMARFGALTR